MFVAQSDKPRSIAILTDAYGLFEPTLAVLEDARKRGITEIYSLGIILVQVLIQVKSWI